MTEKIYLLNPYLTELTANIVKKTFKDGNWHYMLDQTIFYPHMSGGQPKDCGHINNHLVIDVYESDEKIVHVLDTELSNTKVSLNIDWPLRFSNMQHHSAQHILSYAFKKLCNLDTIGFKISDTYTTIDLPGIEINSASISLAESLANTIVQSNINISSRFEEEADKEVLQNSNSNKKLRYVNIDDIDCNPCCGTHVHNTGEIGMIKIIDVEKINGKTRLYFLSGLKAYEDFVLKTNTIKSISKKLSSNQASLISKFDEFWEKYHLTLSLNQKLKEDNLKFQAHYLLENATSLGNCRYISKIMYDSVPSDLKSLAESITKQDNHVAVLGLIDNSICNLVICRSKNIDLDCKELLDKILPLLDGTGGGNEYFVQARGTNIKALEQIIQLINQFISNKLDI